MIWDDPQYLYLLWAVPVIGWFVWRSDRKRREAAHTFADSAMAPRITPQRSTAARWWKTGLLLGGIALLTVAAARPRFGVYFEQVQARGVDLFVCLDVSRSMLAQDVKPSRLARARSDVLDLLEKLQGDRVGLIGFAGKPVVLCPLTTDQAFFKTSLADAGPNSAPRGGSLIGDAIREALASLPEVSNRDQAIVLITDGEDQDSLPLDAADRAAARGVKVFTVGLGDNSEGGRIPVENERGETIYLQHDGEIVWSRMDEALLQEVALRTQGAYVPAGTSNYDLGELYASHLSALTEGEFGAEQRKRYQDRFQIFLLLGLLCLGCEMLLSEYASRARKGAA